MKECLCNIYIFSNNSRKIVQIKYIHVNYYYYYYKLFHSSTDHTRVFFMIQVAIFFPTRKWQS